MDRPIHANDIMYDEMVVCHTSRNLFSLILQLCVCLATWTDVFQPFFGILGFSEVVLTKMLMVYYLR